MFSYFEEWKNFRTNIQFEGIPRYLFCIPMWSKEGKMGKSYVLYRFFYFLIFFIFITQSMLCERMVKIWPIFLTNWSLTCQFIYALLALRIVVLQWKEKSKESNQINLTPTEKLCWLCLNLSLVSAVGVSLTYWLVVYKADETRSACSNRSNICVHGVNMILILMDFFIIQIPIKAPHMIYAGGIAGTYGVFSWLYEKLIGVYYYEDKPYIYELMNWRENSSRAFKTCVLGTLVVCLIHVGFWFLFYLKTLIRNICFLSPTACEKDKNSESELNETLHLKPTNSHQRY